MSKLEKEEEKTIKKWCKANGVLFIKFTPLGEKGWPDRIAVFPGGFQMWVEMKRRGERPTKLQFYRMGQLKSLGTMAEWFDNAEDCIDFFEDCLAAAKEVTDGNTVDPPPLPDQGHINLNKAVRSGAASRSWNGQNGDILGRIRRAKGTGHGQEDAGGGANQGTVRDVETGGKEVE